MSVVDVEGKKPSKKISSGKPVSDARKRVYFLSRLDAL
jgi:hypothetical protein